MKRGYIRIAAVLLVILLLVLLLPEKKTDRKEENTVSSGASGEAQPVYIHIRCADAVRKGNGQYSVEVEFTTDVAVELERMQVVTVFCGEGQSEFFLTEDNLESVHRISFTEDFQPESVRVEARCYQTEKGLLLMQEGEGQLCGEATAPVNGDRLLWIFGGSVGEVYRIYRVAELTELLSGMVELNPVPTLRERIQYASEGDPAVTLVTDTTGNAACNFTREGLSDGIYLLAGTAEACYFCIPRVDASGALQSSQVWIAMEKDGSMQQIAQKTGE